MAIHSLPPGQTLGSAAALSEESGHIVFLLGFCPGLWGHRAAPYQPTGPWPSLLPFQKSHSASWVEWRPGLQEVSMHSVQPRMHWEIARSYASCFPKTRTHKDFHTLRCARARINGKGPQMKPTSTAVFPSFPHTQFFQVLFFCLNRRQRAEPLWVPGGNDSLPTSSLPVVLRSSHPSCGLAKRKQMWGEGEGPPAPAEAGYCPFPVWTQSSQVTQPRKAFLPGISAKK